MGRRGAWPDRHSSRSCGQRRLAIRSNGALSIGSVSDSTFSHIRRIKGESDRYSVV